MAIRLFDSFAFGYVRTSAPPYTTKRHFARICNAIAVGRHKSNEILIVELWR